MLRDGPDDSLIDENLRVCVLAYAKYLCLCISKAPHLNYTQGLSGLPLTIHTPALSANSMTLYSGVIFLFSVFFFQRYFFKAFFPLYPTSAITLISYLIDYGVLCRACREMRFN